MASRRGVTIATRAPSGNAHRGSGSDARDFDSPVFDSRGGVQLVIVVATHHPARDRSIYWRAPAPTNESAPIQILPNIGEEETRTPRAEEEGAAFTGVTRPMSPANPDRREKRPPVSIYLRLSRDRVSDRLPQRPRVYIHVRVEGSHHRPILRGGYIRDIGNSKLTNI